MPFITSQSMETCPRPTTWGQKSQIRHDSIGSAIAPVAEKAEPKGLEVGVDYLCITFHPPTDNPEQRQRVLEPAMPVRSPDGWEGSVYDTAGRHLAPVKDEEPPIPSLLGRVQEDVSRALGCEVEDWVYQEVGMHGYRRSYLGPSGARLLFAPANDTHFHVLLPGQACSKISEVRMRALMLFALTHDATATRCDIKGDDYTKVRMPFEVGSVLNKGGNHVTHAKIVRVWSGFDLGKDGAEPNGFTVYVGSSTSRRQLRIYDKGLESDGEIDAVRWELQERKEAAQSAMQQLAHQPWGKVFAERLVSFVDFRDRGKAQTQHRFGDCISSFARLIGLAEKAVVYAPQPDRTIQQVTDWVYFAMAPTLAILMKAWEGDLSPLYKILDDGKDRLRPKHHRIIAAARIAA